MSSDAKRMHALMIGQPNFGASGSAEPKSGRDASGRFAKRAGPPPPPAPPSPAPKPERS